MEKAGSRGIEAHRARSYYHIDYSSNNLSELFARAFQGYENLISIDCEANDFKWLPMQPAYVFNMVTEGQLLQLIKRAREMATKRNFNQSVELTLVLRDIDVKKGFSLVCLVQETWVRGHVKLR